jgi:hypothetical protein
MVHEIKIDHDGQGTIKFDSLLDYVEADRLNDLVGETFKTLIKAEIDEGGDEDGE